MSTESSTVEVNQVNQLGKVGDSPGVGYSRLVMTSVYGIPVSAVPQTSYVS